MRLARGGGEDEDEEEAPSAPVGLASLLSVVLPPVLVSSDTGFLNWR